MSYYDWQISEEEAKKYEGLTIQKAFADTFEDPERYDLIGKGASPEKAQKLLSKKFGEKAVLVGMRNTKRDLLDAYRHIQFHYVEKNI